MNKRWRKKLWVFSELMLNPKLFLIKCRIFEKFTSISCPCQNIWRIIWKANHFRSNSTICQKREKKASSKIQVQTMWCKSFFYFLFCWGWGGEAKPTGILWSFYQALIFSAGASVTTGKGCDTTRRIACHPSRPQMVLIPQMRSSLGRPGDQAGFCFRIPRRVLLPQTYILICLVT